MKINILDLFDRESQILKKKNVHEIGNIYISFNKISKKFEFLIEDILQRAYGDGIIDLDPTALSYNLDSLYTLWKAPKRPLSEQLN